MRNLFFYILLTSIFVFVLSCDKDEEIDGDKLNNAYNISEVSFTFSNSYIYSKSQVNINTDKLCNIEDAIIMVGEYEATVVTSNENYISIITPEYVKDTVDLSIKTASSIIVIRKDLKVYPSGLSCLEIANPLYESRWVNTSFTVNGKGYIYGGVEYLGYDPEIGYIKNKYDDLWEYDNLTNKWNQRDKETTFNIEDIDSFLSVDVTQIFINDDAYMIGLDYNADDFYIITIQKYDPDSKSWIIELSQNVKNFSKIRFAYQDKNNIYIGMTSDDYHDEEVWCFDIINKTFAYSFSLNMPSDGWMDYCFMSGSILYFYINSYIRLQPTYVEIRGRRALYQYNIDNNETREIDLTNIPIESFCTSPIFSFDGYGIIGEGPSENGSLLKYSNRYFKLIPK